MADPPNHFFKFIPPGFKFNLSIPKSFMTNLSGGRCKKAILRRGRHEWQVEISDRGVFGDGWRKFVIENGVQESDFIVFKHQGNMVFDFLVFDQSTCERQYPNIFDEMDVEEPLTESDSIHTHKRSKKLNKRKRTDYSSQTKDKFQLDDDRCFVTIMTPSYIGSSRLHVPMKFARSNGLITKRMHMPIVHTTILLVDEAQRTWPAKLKINTTRILLTGCRELIIKNHLQVGDACMFELVKHGQVPVFKIYNLGKKPDKNHIQVKKETVNNHSYFVSTLKPSTVKRPCLYLPVEFSIPNGFKTGEMILIDEKGRSWKVKLNKLGEKRFYLGCGLKGFCNANGLTEGDAYKFELIENEKDKPPVLKFSYLGKKPVKNHIQVKKETSSTIKKATCSTLNNRRYFISTLKSYFRKSGLYLPAEFSITNGLKIGEIILRDDRGRSWKVRLNKVDARTFYLGSGLRAFADANGLKEGDTYKFELVENEKNKPPVVNFSLNIDSNPSGKEDRPYYIDEVKSYYIEKSMLYLPRQFARKNGLFNKEEMILKNFKDERSWTVELKRSVNNCSYIGRGWKEFCIAYGLKEGDLFKLELISNGEKPVANFYYQMIHYS